jgi:DNA repair protein RadD
MPVTYKVDDVFISRHVKDGSRDSIRIQYRSGMMFFSEWVCLDHDGYAGIRAQNWWRKRMGPTKQQVTVKMALENFLFPQALAEWTKTVTVKKAGKFFEILAYNRPLEETEDTNGT